MTLFNFQIFYAFLQKVIFSANWYHIFYKSTRAALILKMKKISIRFRFVSIWKESPVPTHAHKTFPSVYNFFPAYPIKYFLFISILHCGNIKARERCSNCFDTFQWNLAFFCIRSTEKRKWKLNKWENNKLLRNSLRSPQFQFSICWRSFFWEILRLDINWRVDIWVLNLKLSMVDHEELSWNFWLKNWNFQIKKRIFTVL